MKRIITGALKVLRNISTRNKLIIIYVLTIVIPMMFMNFISYRHTISLINADIETSLTNLTQQINNSIDDRLKQIDLISSQLYSSKLLSGILSKSRYSGHEMDIIYDDEEFDSFFTYLLLNQPSVIENIYIFTANGNIFYKSYKGQVKTGYDPKNEAWYQEVLKLGGQIAFIGVHHSWPLINSDKEVFSVAREMRDLDGKTLAVILVDFKLDSISRIIQETQNAYGSKFIILDNNQHYVYSDFDSNTSDTINRLLTANAYSSLGTVNGKKMYFTCQYSLFSNWKIISITSADTINHYYMQTLKVNVYITLISLCVYSLLVVLLYVAIYKPIYRLNQAMKAVEAGNFDVKVAECSHDEIGRLSINFNKMICKINDLINSEYKANLIRKDAEFKALQSQINPHFLYNTLQTMSSIAVVMKVPEIDQIAKSLGYMLRYSIKSTGDFVPIAQELEHAKSYVAIQKIRLGDKVTVSFKIQNEVYKYTVLKLIIQPFIENAFKHGIEGVRRKGVIDVEIALVLDCILFIVKDNGAGMSEEVLDALKKSLFVPDDEDILNCGEASIGIQNVHLRLKHFYGSGYSLDIASTLDQGTAISVKFPAIPLRGGSK